MSTVVEPVKKPVEPIKSIDKPDTTKLVGCEQYRPIVEGYDWDSKTMMAIMEAESTHNGIHCDPNAVGDTHPIRGVLAPSCGLFQVRTISPSRGTCEQLKDPVFNVAKAYMIYKGQGLKAWSTWLHGKHIKYLK